MVCPTMQFILLGMPAVDATAQTQFVARHSRESQGRGWKFSGGGSTFSGADCIYARGMGMCGESSPEPHLEFSTSKFHDSFSKYEFFLCQMAPENHMIFSRHHIFRPNGT